MAGPGVVTIKSFSYRGNEEEWTNRYHFTGDAPSSDSDWRDLVDGLVALEAGPLTDNNHIVRAYCYENTDDHSVYTYDLTHYDGYVPGALDHTDAAMYPGDVAMWCRWSTGRTTSKGKPIYLRKYFHGVLANAYPNEDTLYAAQATALEAFALAVLSANDAWPGLADTDGGSLPGQYLAGTFNTTRTLKRRGKRPNH